MSYQCFDVSIADHIAHIRLNRPEKRNNMIRAFWDELPAIVEDIDHNARARVIVISSTGPHFSSGLDTSMFADASIAPGPDAERAAQLQHGARFYEHVLHMQRSFNVLERCRLPVLAAIQGGCIGGGVDLVTACDMRYATEDAFITVFEINIGMTADVGTFPRLCKLIPEGWVRELAYTGRRLPAARAKEIGLVNEVFPDHETLLSEVMIRAREIAEKNPVAVTGSKVMINYARDHSIRDALDYIATWQTGMWSPPHMAEALLAQSERRAPVYPDLVPIKKKM